MPAALDRLRSVVREVTYPLSLPSAEPARQVANAIVTQLDSYVFPRLARMDAPLLVVVGGSTGAGKSTLVNSLARARVSAAGVLRPTTRCPVLACNPADITWFHSGELLPGLTRVAEASDEPGTMQLVAAPALEPGLAFLDAPDIDAVVDENRALATQLLAAADLWLFVTTAARYADAVPWELLHTARARGTVIALVLNRVPPEAIDEVSAHFSEMLAANDLANAPLFVVPESEVDGHGLLPEAATGLLREWFDKLAADPSSRGAIVRQTLDGALAALTPAVAGLAEAADDQTAAVTDLRERLASAYRGARQTVERTLDDGRLFRGELFVRWQEFVHAGGLFRALESRVGHLRDRVVAALTGRPRPERHLQAALEAQLGTVLRDAATDAAERAYASWQVHPAGAELLTPELARPSDGVSERARQVARDWLGDVLDVLRAEADQRSRGSAYASNPIGLTLMVAVIASTPPAVSASLPPDAAAPHSEKETDGEAAGPSAAGDQATTADGTAVAARVVLEAIFGDQAVRTLISAARDRLLARVGALLDEEANRYLAQLATAGVSDGAPGPADRLRSAVAEVEAARNAARLTEGTAFTLPGTPS
ncbi:MAG: ABC transporter [Actinobacteria bacterium]|nr:MAG: ABC transporter [Actinomycetota bacterium]